MAAYTEHDLITRIYDAAFDENMWPCVMSEIADHMRAEHVFLGVHHVTSGSRAIAPRTDPEHLRIYNEHWVLKNPCAPAMMAAPVGHVFHTPGEVLDEDAFRRSEIFNEWYRQGNMGYGALCVALNKSARQSAFASVYKSWGTDSFGTDEREFYSRIVPHLQRAVSLQRRILDLQVELSAATGAMETLDDGLMVVDAAMRVLFMGGATQEIFRTFGMGIELGSTFEPAGYGAQIRQLVRSCLGFSNGSRTGGEVSFSREGRSDIRIVVLPYPSILHDELIWEHGTRPAATIILTDPDLRIARACERFSAAHGLTPAERRFVAEIAKGDGKKRAAERCGISYGTARSHLLSIFEKAGVHRQAELVRLLAGGFAAASEAFPHSS